MKQPKFTIGKHHRAPQQYIFHSQGPRLLALAGEDARAVKFYSEVSQSEALKLARLMRRMGDWYVSYLTHTKEPIARPPDQPQPPPKILLMRNPMARPGQVFALVVGPGLLLPLGKDFRPDAKSMMDHFPNPEVRQRVDNQILTVVMDKYGGA